jgi:hypothetical protein
MFIAVMLSLNVKKERLKRAPYIWFKGCAENLLLKKTETHTKFQGHASIQAVSNSRIRCCEFITVVESFNI